MWSMEREFGSSKTNYCFTLAFYPRVCMSNIREVKLDVYGKRQNGKNKTFAVCLQLSVQ